MRLAAGLSDWACVAIDPNEINAIRTAVQPIDRLGRDLMSFIKVFHSFWGRKAALRLTLRAEARIAIAIVTDLLHIRLR